MKTYMVGGAVRDMLMGMEPRDRDYVVVGGSSAQMISDGFERVGAEFPVFLHPGTGEEYALARTERKTGSGYTGFSTEFGPDVTLEQDLARRDLTINSIAYDVSGYGGYIDPFNGEDDIRNRVLRHTSAAFAEDPVRVLRLARFRARLGPTWVVAPETVEMISKMAKQGVLAELTAERVWKELSRALMEPYARLFFDTLLECDALHVIFPEVYRLKTALEARRWHPEGDAYEHTMLVLSQAVEFGFDLETRVAALVHDFGKAATPRDRLPRHHGHEVAGVPIVENFCRRLRLPSTMQTRLPRVTRYHMHMHRLSELKSATIVEMFERMDAFRDHPVVTLLWQLAICDERGRLGSENAEFGHLSQVLYFQDAARSVRFVDVFPNGEPDHKKIQSGMHRARVAAVQGQRQKTS